MKNTLKLINGIYYLLSDKLAKEGEYALTATGVCTKVDLNKVILWEDGCCRVIGTSDDKLWNEESSLARLATTIPTNTMIKEWECNIDAYDENHIILSNITPKNHTTDAYYDWINWCKANRPMEPLTGSKAAFAEYILNDKEMISMMSNVGVLSDVFASVYAYLKHKN